jgi:imidazolonepropionase-like amidohydrolase
VRDVAGPVFEIKAAIDAGIIPGPRVCASGALISQTSGHGDFVPSYGRPRSFGGRAAHLEELGSFTVSDGVPHVLPAVREQLKKGRARSRWRAAVA